MTDLPDFDLRPATGEPAPAPVRPRASSTGAWVAAALFIAAVGVAMYIAFGFRTRPTPPPAATSTRPAATDTLPALGGRPDTVVIPPLDASDSIVRSLVQALSESPAVMAWLPTKGLIRNFTLVVNNIADGATPAKQLKSLQPSSAFRVVERAGGTYVDARSYERYTAVADAAASIDPASAAKLYATLKPRIEEAHGDLGGQKGSFDRTLARAIASLLETPIVDDPPRLRPKGIGYAYVDDRLESLTPAQRQLLRMGPRNVRVIKARLREIGLALGIPPTQLPSR